MKRSVILVDLDNVVYDWCKSMAWWLSYNDAVDFGVSIAMSTYKSWEVWEDWGIPKGEFIRWWRLGIETGEIYGKGPVIPGSRNALWALSDGEWDIHIATSRLTKFGLHDKIVESTATWLRDNNIPYRNIHFTDSKTAINSQAIVDDRADNMATCHGIRFEFPANHNVGRLVTAEEQKEAWANIVATLT